jgi:hypothetical protein
MPCFTYKEYETIGNKPTGQALPREAMKHASKLLYNTKLWPMTVGREPSWDSDVM